MIPRRYVFRGSASAFGGSLFRPQHVVYDVHGASALAVAGGRSTGVSEKQSFPLASFDSAKTSAHGTFVQHGDASDKVRASTEWNPPDEIMHPVTDVFASVTGLRVGDDHLRVEIASLSSHMVSQATPAHGESAVRVEKDTDISPVMIGGRTLLVELDRELFHELTTRAQLLAALEKEEFIAKHGDSLFLNAAIEGEGKGEGEHAHHHRSRLANRDTIYATIVKRLVWDGESLPGAAIDKNMVQVPNFGRIFFGELLIGEGEKRLTMVRFKLGSPNAGNAAAGDVQNNGQWSP